VLGKEVGQAGSDITAERTRFDFTFPRKLTADEIEQVEALVNDAIIRKLPMTKQTLPKAEAEKSGALFFFKNKYPESVDVYTVGDSQGEWFSKEFCGGPHVTNTGDIGPLKITKEEAVSAGVRRIRATIS
jgi:alanyl-tRNA synthetase